MDNIHNLGKRIESDTLGEVKISGWAYWGAQTQRAYENFTVSDYKIPESLIHSLGLIKFYAAEVNFKSGNITEEIAVAVKKAAKEVMDGKWNEHFPVDVFQTGSGTSWNMNVNEIIANRASEILGYPIGKKEPVHPNDHVNRGQSSNDVIPTAIHIACRLKAEETVKSLEVLQKSLSEKSIEFKNVVKLGRTHLQDAVPMTLGQEFSGYAKQIEKGIGRIKNTFKNLEETALGGTAIGTGINTNPSFGKKVVEKISEHTGIKFTIASNYFEAIACRDTQVELMGALNTVAASCMKIANDLRLLASGPRAGFGEISLPSLQPGSSIMPGKINPVIPEMVIQVAAHVTGKIVSVTIGSQNGPLELNIMKPLIAYECLTSLSLISNMARDFASKCINGIKANAEQCEDWVKWSLALVTPLANKIGYDKAASIAKKAFNEKKSIQEVALEEKVLPEEELKKLLDPKNMI